MVSTNRLFIAINLPDSLRHALARVQAVLRRELQGSSIGWSRVEGIHLTLKFLGDVEESRVSDIGKRMIEIATTWYPIQLELQAVGVFPNATHPKVLWCGLNGELERLFRVQSELEEGLERIGCSRESKPFKPHLTFGRFRDRREIPTEFLASLKRILDQRGDLYVGDCTADSVSLIKSELHPRGAVYTPLFTATFQS